METKSIESRIPSALVLGGSLFLGFALYGIAAGNIEPTGMSIGAPSENQTDPRTGTRRDVPVWQWNTSWEGKPPGDLTEAQKLAEQLVGLVERQNAALGTLRRTMDALRKARREEEAKLETQLSEARHELREVLTTRQEAALVLMNSL